jgi:hypothetical protein
VAETYHGKACPHCGGTLRYRSNSACVKENQNTHLSEKARKAKAERWQDYYYSMPGLMYQRRQLENRKRRLSKSRAERAERVDTQSNQLD